MTNYSTLLGVTYFQDIEYIQTSISTFYGVFGYLKYFTLTLRVSDSLA